MLLLDRTGPREDRFKRVEAGATSSANHILVDWADLPRILAARGRDQQVGVEVANNVKAHEIKLVQRQLSLIAIRFPAFSDGRGFSLARQLRNAGYTGTIRAVGPLIADQFAYALSCGFDEIALADEVAARQPLAHWLAAVSAISRTYQRGFGDGGNILDQRRAARLALRHTAS